MFVTYSVQHTIRYPSLREFEAYKSVGPGLWRRKVVGEGKRERVNASGRGGKGIVKPADAPLGLRVSTVHVHFLCADLAWPGPFSSSPTESFPSGSSHTS